MRNVDAEVGEGTDVDDVDKLELVLAAVLYEEDELEECVLQSQVMRTSRKDSLPTMSMGCGLCS